MQNLQEFSQPLNSHLLNNKQPMDRDAQLAARDLSTQ